MARAPGVGQPRPQSGAAVTPRLPASGRDHIGGGDVFLAVAVSGFGPGVGLDAEAVAAQAQVTSVGTQPVS